MTKFLHTLMLLTHAVALAPSALADTPNLTHAVKAPMASAPVIQLIHKKTRVVILPDRAQLLAELNSANVDVLDHLPGVDLDLAYDIVKSRPYPVLHALVDKKVLSEQVYSVFIDHFPQPK